MTRRREDMSDEEYQSMLKRLEAMRERAKVVMKKKKAEIAARKVVEPIIAQQEPIPKPNISQQEPIVEPAIAPQEPVIAPIALPPKPTRTRARPIPKPVAPIPQAMDETELDRYFAAKYKAKAQFLPQAQPVQQPPVQQPMAAAVRVTAQDQIRNRVNDEVMKLAMKSVFPDWS